MAVELLALYGEDGEEIGTFLPGLRRVIKKGVRFTPQYWTAKGAASLLKKKRKGIHGEEMGAFLPGLTKAIKKVGKFTSPITTKIAKSFLPSSVVDAAAAIDPTKKGVAKKAVQSVAAIVKQPGQIKEVVVVPSSSMKIDTKKILIIGGSVLGALVVLKVVAGAGARR